MVHHELEVDEREDPYEHRKSAVVVVENEDEPHFVVLVVPETSEKLYEQERNGLYRKQALQRTVRNAKTVINVPDPFENLPEQFSRKQPAIDRNELPNERMQSTHYEEDSPEKLRVVFRVQLPGDAHHVEMKREEPPGVKNRKSQNENRVTHPDVVVTRQIFGVESYGGQHEELHRYYERFESTVDVFGHFRTEMSSFRAVIKWVIVGKRHVNDV